MLVLGVIAEQVEKATLEQAPPIIQVAGPVAPENTITPIFLLACPDAAN